MLANARCGFGWVYTNVTANTSPGTSITPVVGSKGNWTALVSAANCANDVYGIRIWVTNGNTSGGIRNICLDIGVDTAGGTNYSVVIPDILCSQASNAVDGGQWFYFPIFVKAGSTIAARAQSSHTTAFRTSIYIYGRPSKPEALAVGQYCETIGATPPVGVSVTPGNSNAWGDWTSIGTTSQALWHWSISCGFDAGTTTALMYLVSLSYGSSYETIIESQPLFLPGTAERLGEPLFGSYWEVPAGSTLYVRARCSGTTASGFNVVATGIGG